VSWRALDQRTNRLARRYAALGVRADDMVTIALGNGIGFLEATIATWKLGATPQPVSWRAPQRDLDRIVALARSALVVTEEIGPDLGPDDDSPLPPCIANHWKAPTSGGSTGQPKLIVSTQPADARVADAFATLLGIDAGGAHLVTGPLYHNGPFTMAALSLLLGKRVVVMPRFQAADTLALIDRHQVDLVYLVPTMMHRILRLPDGKRRAHDLASLRQVMHTAAPCPPWLKRAWIEWLGPDRIIELYAGTEFQAATLITGREWLARSGSVGRPLFGEIQILDDEARPVAPETVGEVWMRPNGGGAPPYEYVGAEARRREDGWESLGDMGYLDNDGYLYLTDRRADMIVVGGSNVYPAEVEAALEEHPAVFSSCVIGLPDPELGSRPHALVQTGLEVDDEELRAHLLERVLPYKVPRTFERVDHNLRDDAGKVARYALRAERCEFTGADQSPHDVVPAGS
jgi:bile acid-coenzyme A ligase